MMSCYWQLKTLEQSWEIEPSQARTGKPNLWLGQRFFVHRAGKNLFKIIPRGSFDYDFILKLNSQAGRRAKTVDNFDGC